MKKIDAIKKIREFVNHYDGGNIQHYVAEHLVNFLVDELGMLPPFDKDACYLDGDNANQESIKYCKWEDENETND